jgi:hypothetical protein
MLVFIITTPGKSTLITPKGSQKMMKRTLMPLNLIILGNYTATLA